MRARFGGNGFDLQGFSRFGDARVGRAHFDPELEVGDFFGGELLTPTFARGHLQIFIGVANGLNQQTLVRVARYDSWTGITSL